MSKKQLLKVPEFSIQNEFGKLSWQNVDLTFVDLKKEVFISQNEAEVYPNEETKPEQGKKLNKTCQIELYGI